MQNFHFILEFLSLIVAIRPNDNPLSSLNHPARYTYVYIGARGCRVYCGMRTARRTPVPCQPLSPSRDVVLALGQVGPFLFIFITRLTASKTFHLLLYKSPAQNLWSTFDCSSDKDKAVSSDSFISGFERIGNCLVFESVAVIRSIVFL